MSGLTDLLRFSIVVVPFPYADQLAEKRRPALIISSPNFHASTGLVWVAMITSAKNTPWQNDISIEDHHACGLPAASVIRPVKIATIDISRVLGKLGMLADQEAQLTRRYFAQTFE